MALRVLGLLLAAHVTPPRAWYTVDALAVASVGIALAWDAGARGDRTDGSRKVAGYFVLGAAALCKQNFLALAPIALVVLGDWRRPGCWLAAFAPGAVYALSIVALGGGPDLVAQLGAQHGLIAAGIGPYFSVPMTAGVALGALAGWLPRRAHGHTSHATTVARGLGPFLVVLAPLGLLTTAVTGSYGHYARVSAFALLGIALGRASALVATLDRWTLAATNDCSPLRGALLALAFAWTSAISLGYPSPAYASGILAALVLLLDRPAGMPALRRFRVWIAVLAVLACVGSFAARTRVVYRDQPAALLTRPLGAVLRGGTGIRTNPRTADFLADLNRAIAFAEVRGRPYAVLPDLPVHWATARQPNSLPIDWPLSIELHTPALAARVDAAIERFRGTGLFLVQKVRADTLATTAMPLADVHRYPIVERVRATMTKIGETTFFDVYD